MAALLADVLMEQPYLSSSLQCDLAAEYNSAVIEKLKGRKQHLPVLHKYLFQLGDSLLHSNQPKEALVQFKKLLKNAIEEKHNPTNVAEMYDRLGICHLRIGEQSNCIHHHSNQSCIFPLEGAGVHQDPSGAAMSMKYYQAALEL